MLNFLVIFIGGGIGASLRHSLSLLTHKYLGINYPYGTFFVNIIGCLFLGFITALVFNKIITDQNLKLFLTTGIAGGFTTFSTFGYESLTLLKQGHILLALIYIISSIVLGILAVFFGSYLAKFI